MQKTYGPLKDLFKDFLEEKLEKKSSPAGVNAFGWTETDEINFGRVYELVFECGSLNDVGLNKYSVSDGAGTDECSKVKVIKDGEAKHLLEVKSDNGMIIVTMI